MTCNYDDSLSIPLQVDTDFSGGIDTSISTTSSTISNITNSSRGRQRLIDFSRHKATDIQGRCVSRSRSRSRSQSICRVPLPDTDKPLVEALVAETTYFLKDSLRSRSRSGSRSRSSSRSSHRSTRSCNKSVDNNTAPTFCYTADSLLGHDSFACESDFEDDEEDDLRMVQSDRLPTTTSTSIDRDVHGYDASLRLLDLEDDDDEEPHSSYPMPNLGYGGSQRHNSSRILLDRNRGSRSMPITAREEQQRIVIPTRRRRSMGGGSDRGPSNCSSLPSLLDGSSSVIVGSIHTEDSTGTTGTHQHLQKKIPRQQSMRSSSFCTGSSRRSMLGRSKSLGRHQVMKEGSVLADTTDSQAQLSGSRTPTTPGGGVSRRFRQHRRRSSLGLDGSNTFAESVNTDGSGSSSAPDGTPPPLSRPTRRSSLVGTTSNGEQLLMASMSSLNNSRRSQGSGRKPALPPRSKTISSYTTTRGKSTGEDLLGTSNHGFLTGSRIKRTFLDGSQSLLS